MKFDGTTGIGWGKMEILFDRMHMEIYQSEIHVPQLNPRKNGNKNENSPGINAKHVSPYIKMGEQTLVKKYRCLPAKKLVQIANILSRFFLCVFGIVTEEGTFWIPAHHTSILSPIITRNTLEERIHF